MSYDLYRTSSIYESSANAVNVNPSLAAPGYYSSEHPTLIHGVPEKPFPHVADELGSYTPLETAAPEATYDTDDSEFTYIARINLGLKARVAELIAEETRPKQEIEKIIIPSLVTQEVGARGLLLAAASSL